MDLNKMYSLVVVFSPAVVREVLELTKITNSQVVTDIFNDMNMSNHAECAEYLFS